MSTATRYSSEFTATIVPHKESATRSKSSGPSNLRQRRNYLAAQLVEAMAAGGDLLVPIPADRLANDGKGVNSFRHSLGGDFKDIAATLGVELKIRREDNAVRVQVVGQTATAEAEDSDESEEDESETPVTAEIVTGEVI